MKSEKRNFRLRPGVVKSDIGTMVLVYNPFTESFLVLNETAGKLVSLLEQGNSFANMLKGLNDLYKERREGAHREYVENFIRLSLENKITEEYDGTAANYMDIKLPQVFGESEQPVLKEFDKKWILENHPDAIYDPAFGDHWSPASGGH